MSIYTTLQRLNIELPAAAPPVGAYLMSAQSGALVYLSGHIAKRRPAAGR